MTFLRTNEINLLNQNSRIEILVGSSLKNVADNLIKTSFYPNKNKRIIIFTTKGFLKRGELLDFLNYLDPFFYLNYFAIPSNPEIEFLDNLCSKLKKNNEIDLIVAIGGGSVIDSAKVISALLNKKNTSLSVKTALQLKVDKPFSCVQVLAIPTTSGTGSEVTPFATIWDFKKSIKYSLEHLEKSVHKIFLIPELTISCPRDLTLNCALDTCSHAVETLWNRYRTEKSTQFALKALDIFNSTINLLLDDLNNIDLRFFMQLSAVWAGLAISINHTSLAHAISYDLTLKHGVPHGFACSCTLNKIDNLLHDNKEWILIKNNEIVQKTFLILRTIDFDEILKKYGINEFAIDKVDPIRAKNFILDISKRKINL